MKLDLLSVLTRYPAILKHFYTKVLNTDTYETNRDFWFHNYVHVHEYEDDSGWLVFLNDRRYNDVACYTVKKDLSAATLLWTNSPWPHADEDKEV